MILKPTKTETQDSSVIWDKLHLLASRVNKLFSEPDWNEFCHITVCTCRTLTMGHTYSNRQVWTRSGSDGTVGMMAFHHWPDSGLLWCIQFHNNWRWQLFACGVEFNYAPGKWGDCCALMTHLSDPEWNGQSPPITLLSWVLLMRLTGI